MVGPPCRQHGAWPSNTHSTPRVHLGARGHCGQELMRGHLSRQGTVLPPLATDTGLFGPRSMQVQAVGWLEKHLPGLGLGLQVGGARSRPEKLNVHKRRPGARKAGQSH